MTRTVFVIFLISACGSDQSQNEQQGVPVVKPEYRILRSSDTGVNMKPFRKLNILDDPGVIYVTNSNISKFTSMVLKKRGGRYDDRSTYVVDLNRVVDQYDTFARLAPNVEVHYAIKANSDPYLSYMMARLGAGFDCASKHEIEAVIDGLRVDPGKIIFANTAKSGPSIQYAADKGVPLTIFDNVSELDKLAARKVNFKLLIRLIAVVKNAKIPFSDKYGATMAEVPCLLGQARDRGLDVIGVHFHLGEGFPNTRPFVEYIRKAKKVFDTGLEMGFNMSVLDIGGGFTSYPNDPGIRPEEILATVNRTVARLFKGQKVRLLAEPGRFFATLPFDLYATVINRRLPHDTETTQIVYYINEPWTGQLNQLSFYPFQIIEPVFVEPGNGEPFDNCPPANQTIRAGERYESLIYGPTCLPFDRYNGTPSLPLLNVGDILKFTANGAYSVSDGTRFNGFQRPKVFYTIRPEHEHLLK
ncbi:Ornithine decarboxylase [Halotydeus destructor]|nr:Ornithine decarboxylase [Halotydeus destructor]